MSKNVDHIKSLYRAYRSGDYEAFARLCTPDLEWIQNEGFPYGGRHVGPSNVVEGVFRTLAGHWEGFRFVDTEMLDAGDHVVVLGAYEGRHRETGKSFRAHAAHVFDFRDGLVARFRQYCDTALVVAACST